jgi:hypothetical protein
MNPDSRDLQQAKARQPHQSVPRRSMLHGAALTGMGAVTGLPSSGFATFENPRSEVAIAHPAGWSITARLSPRLVYPHESFCLASASIPGMSEEADLPNLAVYPRDAIVYWLLHYDSIVDRSDPVGFDYAHLVRRPSEFDEFLRYSAAFSGSQRSFLLRLWIGGGVTTSTRSLLRRSLRSLAVR